MRDLVSSRLPLLVLACLLVLSALGLSRPSSVAAQTRTGHEFYYYSDDTYTELVGYQVWCIGYHDGWGITTGYVDIEDYPYCPNG